MGSTISMQPDSSGSINIPKGVQGAWQGGPCHQCGDDMPANLVHCQSCRALLNSELTEDSVEIPKFVPLREIHLAQAVVPKGHYVQCPGCQAELKINAKYKNASVACRFCDHSFTYDTSATIAAIYADCPHCRKQLRASSKYAGQRVACRFCSGPLMLAD
jgi:Zn finger protein HypA/HybF involved in hydrogenase expression